MTRFRGGGHAPGIVGIASGHSETKASGSEHIGILRLVHTDIHRHADGFGRSDPGAQIHALGHSGKCGAAHTSGHATVIVQQLDLEQIYEGPRFEFSFYAEDITSVDIFVILQIVRDLMFGIVEHEKLVRHKGDRFFYQGIICLGGRHLLGHGLHQRRGPEPGGYHAGIGADIGELILGTVQQRFRIIVVEQEVVYADKYLDLSLEAVEIIYVVRFREYLVVERIYVHPYSLGLGIPKRPVDISTPGVFPLGLPVELPEELGRDFRLQYDAGRSGLAQMQGRLDVAAAQDEQRGDDGYEGSAAHFFLRIKS